MDWKMKLKMYLRLNFLYQFLAIFTALIALFMAGIHTAWTSVYIPKLLNADPFKVTNDGGSWIVVSLSFGAVIGSILTPLAHQCGRKPIILLTSVPYLISPLLLVLANSIIVLYIARVIAGIAIGLTISLTPQYLSEIAHEKIRGAFSTFFEVFTILGLLFVNCLGEQIGNLFICIVLIGVGIIFAIIFVLMPESPYFLMLTNKYNKARSSLTTFHGRDAVKHYYRLKAAVEAQAQNKGKLTDIFTIQVNRRALGILCVVLSGKQLSADGAIDAYGQTIFRMVSDQICPSLIAAIYYSSKLLIVIITSFLIDKIGRRQILLLSFLITGFCSIIVGSHLYVKQHYAVYSNPVADHIVLAFLILLGVFHCVSSTLPMIMLGEMFPVNVKRYVFVFFGIYSFSNLSLSIMFFHFISTNFGAGISFFSYAISGFFHYILVYIFVFETAGKTLEEIQEELSDETSSGGSTNVSSSDEEHY